MINRVNARNVKTFPNFNLSHITKASMSSDLVPLSGGHGSVFVRPLAFILLCLPFATMVFMYLDVILLMATQHLEIVSFDRPAKFVDRLQIYVVSLPDRYERRADMERLRQTLGLQWEYYNAMPADNPLVGQILDWVEATRSLNPSSPNVTTKISWPEHLEDIAKSGQEIPLMNSNIGQFLKSEPPYQPLVCNKNDYDIPAFALDQVPDHLRLTPARVACWHSHLSVIHQHANSLPSEKASIALILEDDVDLERDIVSQMESLWTTLPEDWDMVFLGHCWSDETRGRMLFFPIPSMGVPNGTFTGSRMYVSSSPKCTHAYALSRIGARRLLLHLTHPLFAYSRAIDQGLAWLMESGRIKSFSVVPNLAIQRKVTPSDVREGGALNAHWKATLFNGVFQNLLGE